MNTETLTILPKGEDFEITVQHDQTGSAYGIPLSKSAYEQLREHFVGGSLTNKIILTKNYMNITDKELIEKIYDEMPGWDIHISGTDLINELIKRYKEREEIKMPERKDIIRGPEYVMHNCISSAHNSCIDEFYQLNPHLKRNPQTDGE